MSVSNLVYPLNKSSLKKFCYFRIKSVQMRDEAVILSKISKKLLEETLFMIEGYDLCLEDGNYQNSEENKATLLYEVAYRRILKKIL